MDLGTGDGRAVLERARREPDAFVIGLDASAAAMAESSLRASRPTGKGGLPNAIFVVAAAERPPSELRGIADELTIEFPWGSLLRGALAAAGASEAADGIAGLLRPGGAAMVLLSVDPRDGLDVPPLETTSPLDLAARWRCHGLEVTGWRRATDEEIRATASSWGRRLRAGRDRAVWRLDLTRPRTEPAADGAVPGRR